MSISLDDVRHIAVLARLGLSAERAEAIAAELNTILAHMDVLSRIDTAGAQGVAGAGAAAQPLRPDCGPAIPLARAAEAFAPAMRDGFFLVPRLTTHEDSEASS
jgi:aspartyl-tRNA(Asn)/glutamyl-tRNA(Gln) amidotransferase subunit C